MTHSSVVIISYLPLIQDVTFTYHSLPVTEMLIMTHSSVVIISYLPLIQDVTFTYHSLPVTEMLIMTHSSVVIISYLPLIQDVTFTYHSLPVTEMLIMIHSSFVIIHHLQRLRVLITSALIWGIVGAVPYRPLLYLRFRVATRDVARSGDEMEISSRPRPFAQELPLVSSRR